MNTTNLMMTEDLTLGHKTMAIKINIYPIAEDLTGKSHWWGFPDLPEAFEWPSGRDSETLLTFICQIRLEEIAELDTEGRLPHKGMLWFFADLDYFLGDLEAPCGGSGEWEADTFKVLYSEDCSDLLTHEYYWEDGSPPRVPAPMLHHCTNGSHHRPQPHSPAQGSDERLCLKSHTGVPNPHPCK